MNGSEPSLIDRIRDAITRVPDPEYGIGIVDLGLLRDVSVDGPHATITMTLTTMYCPAGDVILAGVKAAAEAVPGIAAATVTLTWDPPWTPDDLTPAGRRELGWDEGSSTPA